MSVLKWNSKIRFAVVSAFMFGLLVACSSTEVQQIEGERSASGIQTETGGKTSGQSDFSGDGPNSANDDGKVEETPASTGDAHQEFTDEAETDDGPVDESIAALVNKDHQLESTYAPDDLVNIEVPTVLQNPEVNQLRKEAAEALKGLFEAAEAAGLKLYARSGYRSYQTQATLYDGYVARNGEEAASRYSAKAGQSEHQTGLAVDVTSASVDLQLSTRFGDTEEGMWLADNAHKHGFIIRYPKGKEDITGYMYEPWHIRYLGVDLATKVYDSGLTFEEYLQEGEKS